MSNEMESMNTTSTEAPIRLGTHGENYGSWMSNSVFIIVIAGIIFSGLMTVVSFALFHIVFLGAVFLVITLGLMALLVLITWVRRQYSFNGGQIMSKVHETILSHMDYDGNGELLEVGCGSGALSIRCAKKWPNVRVTGIDYWAAVYNYSQICCEKNALLEGVGARCHFQPGDARSLDFEDEHFDAVISNYVYHNITGVDRQDLLLESLRVLKKGGVFALNDSMKPLLYGDMEEFAQNLRNMGYEDVQLIDTAKEVFGSGFRAKLMFLPHSTLLVGRK